MIDYLEFTVRDMAESKRFYNEAFGWTFNDYGDVYAGIQRGDGEAGGFMVGEPAPGGVLVILYSGDVDASIEAVKKAGGTIVKELYDFPGGRRFHFTDPNGYELAVWTDK